MTTKEQLKDIISLALKDAGFVYAKNIEILQPIQIEHGDYSTNVAFALAKKEKKSPKKIAEKIIDVLKKDGKSFKEVELAGAGFINFFLAGEYLQKKLGTIMDQKEDYGKKKQENSEKIQVEFISANPTGLLHLGHARNGFYGDTLARVLKKAGYDVEREYYVNDAKESTQIREFGKTLLGRGDQYKSEYIESKKEVIKSDIKDESELGNLMTGEVLKDIKKTIKNAGIGFDEWFSESVLYGDDRKEKILEELDKKDLTYKEDGALWLKTSDFGDEKDRVIVRSTGDITYFLSDILYHRDKIARGFKIIIDIWGADHQGHEKRMQAVMKILNYDGELIIPIIQMMHLKTKDGAQKMSKRAGTAINLDWLINEVGKDVARFMMISSDINSQMTFDLEVAKEKSQKNPVFYIQYALVRCYGILRKTNSQRPIVEFDKGYLVKNLEASALAKEMIKFPDLVKEVAKNYEVHHLATYALNLAKKLHQFYKNNRIIEENDGVEKINEPALYLIEVAKIVFENLFDVIGIEKIEEM
jgi:arginyl-tRNA synthetase